MLVPDIKPGELLWGYVRRLSFVNGFTQPGDAVRYLDAMFGKDAESVIELFAVLLQCEVEELLRLHTLFPVSFVLKSPPSVTEDGRSYWVRHRDMVAFDYPRDSIRVCPQCVTEDVDFWGISYYRRDHQLPGRWCCEKHERALIKVPAVYGYPEDALTMAPGGPPSALPIEEVVEHEIVLRYLAIMDAWLSGEMVLTLQQLPAYLQYLGHRNACCKSAVPKRALFTMALDSLPHSWLEDLFSRYPRRLLATRLKVLDDLMVRRACEQSVENYALAFALLTESVEDAIDVLSRPPVKRTPLSPALEQVSASGVPAANRPVSLRKPADLSRQHAKDWLDAISMPEWTSLPQPAIDALIDFSSGMSLNDSLSRNGVPLTLLEPLLRSASRLISEVASREQMHSTLKGNQPLPVQREHSLPN